MRSQVPCFSPRRRHYSTRGINCIETENLILNKNPSGTVGDNGCESILKYSTSELHSTEGYSGMINMESSIVLPVFVSALNTVAYGLARLTSYIK